MLVDPAIISKRSGSYSRSRLWRRHRSVSRSKFFSVSWSSSWYLTC